MVGVELGRDYEATHTGDITTASAGHACVVCGEPLATTRGVELANTFQLGTRYSAATFVDADGEHRHVVMGSYGIGMGRTLQCVVEEHHDDAGIIWPVSSAPFLAHVVALPGGEAAADSIADRLGDAGLPALVDDRDERAGVKFADADLIGVPLRVTLGKRGVERGAAELRWRASGEVDELPLDAGAEGWRRWFDDRAG